MSKKDNGAALILAYLNEKNRPYSAQDVFSNLQKQHGLGKTAVVKAMELLALEGKIKEKIYGKQKIYFADQAQFKDVNDADLKSMDHQISELSGEVQSLTQSCRQLDAGQGEESTRDLIYPLTDVFFFFAYLSYSHALVNFKLSYVIAPICK
uniref:Homologous-pairing protein 2 homolog n=1 Tax=Oreochromis niloticus TaxID=8128 RepID=A0A669EQV6_ORENI